MLKPIEYIMGVFVLFMLLLGGITTCVNLANAVEFTYENASASKATLVMYWWDHEFDYPMPVAVHGGDYQAGEVYEQHIDYPGKLYELKAYQGDNDFSESIKVYNSQRVRWIFDGVTINVRFE